MTEAPELTEEEELSMISTMMAETAAHTSMIADLFFIMANIDAEPIMRLRDHARHLQTAAELGALIAEPGQDVVTFHRTRHDILEEVCSRAGFPHKGADVIPLDPRRTTAH